MVRTPIVDKNGIRRGAWSEDEDNKLRAYVERFGHANWQLLPKYAGLMRCGKSCRLRWMNYLRPGLKKGKYSHEEEELIIKLHMELGNRWSAIAAILPGRSDNDVKNHWHAHLKKRARRLTNCINNSSSMEQFTESSQLNEQPASVKVAVDASEVSSSDLSSTPNSLLNGITDWIQEESVFSSPELGLQQELSFLFNSLPTLETAQTNPIDNFQMEPLDHFWNQPFDNFWTEPFSTI
ncbi:unnamed protein product [Withania somnifera]